MAAARSGRRSLAPGALVAAVAGLVIVVAAASTAARPQDRPVTSSNPRWLLDLAGSVAGVFVVFAVAVLVTGFQRGRRRDDDDPDAEGRRHRSWQRALVFAVGWLCLALISWLLFTHGRLQPRPIRPAPTAVPPVDRAVKPPASPAPRRIFDPWVALAATAATVALAGGLAAAARRRRPVIDPVRPGPDGETDLVAAMVDESLAAIAAERDPRRAVIAAYASMERWLRRAGAPREQWEAPFEYLDRVLVAFGARAATAATLTGLFEDARFGSHPIAPDRRDEAIAALDALRAEVAPRA